jgi:hypothetical protein
MLELEKALHLTAADSPVMRTPLLQDPQDLVAYLNLLEEIGAFESRKADARLYAEEFRLEAR